MTLDEIRKMTDDELRFNVASTLGWDKWIRIPEDGYILACPPDPAKVLSVRYREAVPDWPRDLNAAMQLVPQNNRELAFESYMTAVLDCPREWTWQRFVEECDNKPRALCKALLLWKSNERKGDDEK